MLKCLVIPDIINIHKSTKYPCLPLSNIFMIKNTIPWKYISNCVLCLSFAWLFHAKLVHRWGQPSNKSLKHHFWLGYHSGKPSAFYSVSQVSQSINACSAITNRHKVTYSSFLIPQFVLPYKSFILPFSFFL